MTRRTSVALTAELDNQLRDHLLRPDGQEDICLVTYRRSTGVTRTSALLRTFIEPRPDDRRVHGNASINGTYVTRAAAYAAEHGEGLALCHSHPGGGGWQSMSGPDLDAETSYANLVREITSLPLVGLTLAGRDSAWSARHWDRGVGANVSYTDCESVRVVGSHLRLSWNDPLRPPPQSSEAQRRTVSCWGEHHQADLARRRVLVVGLGSVGLDVAVRLAATGLVDIGLMDFDSVEPINLDRLIGATKGDARLRRLKIDVAKRVMLGNATADQPRFFTHRLSVCEPEGLRHALDYDVVFSCVDGPWPRAVLNGLAYTDLIPVIDGGVAIDRMRNGGMRNATWRSHVVGPGFSCLECIGQLDSAAVPLDIEGLLDDPQYVAGAGVSARTNSNVAILSVSAAASLLAQFVSLNVAPGGFGAPGPIQYLLSTHSLEHLDVKTKPDCGWEQAIGHGDERLDLTGRHRAAEMSRQRSFPGRWIRALPSRVRRWRRSTRKLEASEDF